MNYERIPSEFAVIGRGIEVAQWGQTDTHAKRMKQPLHEVYEVVVEGDNVTYRAAYHPTVDSDGPIAVLDVFIKKSKSGTATPQPTIDRIKSRLTRIKEILHE
ncbi:MAG TPA: type II toxin-antitoxin system RelE/ParE family toxin [Candidatus Elarobacter sp.]|nr:type II toxin-antitoxin system RelE/ParE family toxin [Candidatus Elarobacter sp.]